MCAYCQDKCLKNVCKRDLKRTNEISCLKNTALNGEFPYTKTKKWKIITLRN